MTQEVLVTVSGLHSTVQAETPEEEDAIEVISPGRYYFKNKKHYILYDEAVEGLSGDIKNTIKIDEKGTLEVMKTGLTNSHLFFEMDKTHMCYYDTPYGQLQVAVHTKNVSVEEDAEELRAVVEYGLDINQQEMADCKIEILVQPREGVKIWQGEEE